jgi:hypothetical protein
MGGMGGMGRMGGMGGRGGGGALRLSDEALPRTPGSGRMPKLLRTWEMCKQARVRWRRMRRVCRAADRCVCCAKAAAAALGVFTTDLRFSSCPRICSFAHAPQHECDHRPIEPSPSRMVYRPALLPLNELSFLRSFLVAVLSRLATASCGGVGVECLLCTLCLHCSQAALYLHSVAGWGHQKTAEELVLQARTCGST